MLKRSIYIGAAFIIISLFILYASFQLPGGHVGLQSGTFPMISAIAILIFSIAMIVENWYNLKKGRKESPPEISLSVIVKIIIFTITTLIYARLALPYLGFVYSTILLMISMFRLAGYKNWIKNILLSIFISLVLYYVFHEVFMIILPAPQLPLPHP